jgi:hypothetical protein
MVLPNVRSGTVGEVSWLGPLSGGKDSNVKARHVAESLKVLRPSKRRVFDTEKAPLICTLSAGAERHQDVNVD